MKRQASIRPTGASAATIHEVHGPARLLNAADRRLHLFHVRFINCEVANLGGAKSHSEHMVGVERRTE
jgi:hypothetical protein